MRSQISELVDEVYAEHEGRSTPKPRLRTSARPACPPQARTNWEAISAEITIALSVSPAECSARAAIAAEERHLASQSLHLNRRIDAQLSRSGGLLGRLRTSADAVRSAISR